jgi:hypothetical protein
MGKFLSSSAFPFREDLDQEEKAKFGEYCSSKDGKGREWFARYVSAQVSGRKQRGTRGCITNSQFLHFLTVPLAGVGRSGGKQHSRRPTRDM